MSEEIFIRGWRRSPGRTSRKKEIEEHYGMGIREILKDSYRECGTQRAVAEKLGVSQSTVQLWIKELGLITQYVLVDPQE